MPRPNAERSIGAEEVLRSTLPAQREVRGWTMEQLAEQMTEAGCPVHASAIYKIEREGRRITLDEAVCLAVLFGTTLDDMLATPVYVPRRLEEMRRLVARFAELAELDAELKGA